MTNQLTLTLFSDREKWNSQVKAIPETSYYHSWDWLNCLEKFPGAENKSFIIDGLAVCPLGITEGEGRFGSFPCGVPAIAPMPEKERRKLLDYIFAFYPPRINLAWHPLNQECSFRNSFEMMRYGLEYKVENTLVMDLSQDMTLGISKYHYRHIKRAAKKGITVRSAPELFAKFQEAHFLSAKRMTRPQETWDAMKTGMDNKAATLFAAFFQGIPISFLYCGEFSNMAFGWSQANLEEYERYCPRHILEWEAMLDYKRRGFKYYEVGERYFTGHTDKEISIGVFKERYGGFLLPKIKWSTSTTQPN